MLRQRKNRKRLQRAYEAVFWHIAEQESKVEADPGMACPTFASVSAWGILTEELKWNPTWSSSELREEDARHALLFLTRWLDAGIETLLTGDRERGREHAARFVPLPPEVSARPVFFVDKAGKPSRTTVGLPDGLDEDECYYRVRELMGDVTAYAFFRRFVQELGGTSGLWRIWVGDHLKLARDCRGRARERIGGWVCPVHPPAISHEADVAVVLEALGPRLERLATSPEGEPLQYPDWAVRTLLKMELADVLGLMDDVVAETEPSLASEKPSPETYSRLEAVYDRVFAEHGMTGLVDEVSRRVLLGGDDAVAYLESGESD